MLTAPSIRIAAFAAACLMFSFCAKAQMAAPADQGTAPGASSSQPAPEEPTPPQLAIRTKGKSIPTTVPADSKNFPDAQKYIERNFGPGYLLAPKMPVLLGDMDGDGLEDAVFIVSGGNPLIGAGAYEYTVLDPYDGYWSFGDPTLNAHIRQTDAGPHYYVLIAHDWRGEKPKAKYVFINLPFKQISLTPTMLGGRFTRKRDKKLIAALATVENDGQTGAVFWNGRTYKFVQLGNVDD
jgi:hypothetical protein